jgi:hypothetical protein
MTDWTPTCELRRYDDTAKLTNPRLQQKWRCTQPVDSNGYHTGYVYEWRDVPLVWEKNPLFNQESTPEQSR